MTLPQRDPRQAVNGTAGHIPVRRANSARRTSSIDMSYPEGLGKQMRMEGRARDIVTIDPASAPIVVDEDWMSAGIGEFRTIEDIVANIDHPGLARLVGCRGGGYLRKALDEHLPDVRQAGSPLALLLDDISGASLVAGFVWSRWRPKNWTEMTEGRREINNQENICIGFATGNSSLEEIARGHNSHRIQQVVPIENPADPHAFHDAKISAEIEMRRARWVDVWRDDDTIVMSAGFQDSTTDPDPEIGRIAVHEYLVTATADARTMTLQSIHADPRVLPFIECPNAVRTAQEMVGTPIAELRKAVLDKLYRQNGCTHLNDAMRSLAEVPVLLRYLDEHVAQ